MQCCVSDTDRPNARACFPEFLEVQGRLEPKCLTEQSNFVSSFICHGSGKICFMKQILFAMLLNQFLVFCYGFSVLLVKITLLLQYIM